MKAITTHSNVDFDGLASMILAKKLYPDFRVFLPRKQSRAVKEFLALYKDEFSFLENMPQEEKIKELILVDTRKIPSSQDRVEKLIIYDHHPPFSLQKGERGEVRKVGATATILLEKIKEKRLNLSEAEKVVSALAIYSDTLSFTAGNTSREDFRAALYLWEEGFNQSLLREYLNLPLNEQQQEVLNELLQKGQVWKMKGYDIHVFTHCQEEYLTGINLIAQTLLDIRDADAVLLVLQSKNKLVIVGRSGSPNIDIGSCLSGVGGGGHRGAGSAQVEKMDMEKLLRKLEKNLQDNIVIEYTAADIMSSPVKTVTPDTAVEKAEKIMEFYGHNGLIVTEGEKILGVFSRRDFLKVKKHGLTHAPVKGYMSRKIVTVKPETPLAALQEIMIKKDVGRLPVVEKEGKLVGIVTRSDLLKIHHDEQVGINRYGGQLVLPDLKVYDRAVLLENLSSDLEELLSHVARGSEKLGIQVYGVGGFVRDLLLGGENPNLDLIVEKDGKKLGEWLREELGGEVVSFPEYNTVTLRLPNGPDLDIAQTRQEYYEFPAAQPQVEPASLKQDLYRRDFTVNAMVISLSPQNWGKMLDMFGGFEDLNKRRLQALHALSFIDDPQRIFRGLGLILRYGFSFSPDTRSLIREAMQVNVLKNLPPLVIKDHLRSLLHMGKWGKLVREIDNLKMWEGIFPFAGSHPDWQEGILVKLENLWYKDREEKLDPLLLFLQVIAGNFSPEEKEELIENWHLGKKAQKLLLFEMGKQEAVSKKLTQTRKPVEIQELLQKFTREFCAGIWAGASGSLQEKVEDYLFRTSRIRNEVSGKDLLQMGFSPGPELGRVLQKIRDAKINREITSRQEELEMAQKLLKVKGGKNRDDC